jgi:hypothetical protein
VISALASNKGSRTRSRTRAKHLDRTTCAHKFQREVRRSRYIHATLVQHGCADRPCVVSDVSSIGAKIVVSGEAAIPTHFELVFDIAGTRRLCELVRWQGKTAGVKFVR